MNSYKIIKTLRKREATSTFLAENFSGEKVIIKKFHIAESKDWKSVELFKREAETVKSLRHQGIPLYLDSFMSENDGTFSIVQEFIEGVSLQEKIDSGAMFTPTEIENFLKKMVQIISYLQSFTPPVIHRDIKPSNIILKNGDITNPILIDFGSIQRAISSDFTVVGTTGFSAPEQSTGRAFPQSDFYALGTTLLYILTKKEPIDIPFENMRFNYQKIVTPPKNIANFIDKTTLFNPTERPQTTDELLDILYDKIFLNKNLQKTDNYLKNISKDNNFLVPNKKIIKIVVFLAVFFLFITGFLMFFLVSRAPVSDMALNQKMTEHIRSYNSTPIQKSSTNGIEGCIQKECRTYNLSCDENSLQNMTNFSCNDQSITSLSGVEKLKNLKNIYVYNNNISDLSPLSKLEKLEKLEKISMGKNSVSSLEPIKNLKNLKHLTFYENNITDLTPLKNLTQLEELVIWKNPFTDLTPLSSLKNLKILEVSHNKNIKSISSLKSLENIETFKASYCSLDSIDGLQNSKKIVTLDIASNNIADLSLLNGIKFLKSLIINDNKISDLSPILESENMEYIQMSNNQISDITPLKKMTKLETIWAYNNKIESISVLENMIYLKSLNFWNNRIKDPTPLKNLGNLGKLDLTSNCIEDFSELKKFDSFIKRDKQNNCSN